MHDVLSPYVWWCHTGSLTLVPVTRGLNFLQCQSQNSTSKLEPRLGPGIVSTPAYFGCCFFFFFWLLFLCSRCFRTQVVNWLSHFVWLVGSSLFDSLYWAWTFKTKISSCSIPHPLMYLSHRSFCPHMLLTNQLSHLPLPSLSKIFLTLNR